MFENIIFDFDGTLCDTRKGIVHCVRQVFFKLGKKEPKETEVAKYIGPPLGEMFANLLHTTDNVFIKNSISIFRKEYAKTELLKTEFFPGIRELLNSLYISKKKLLIVTNKPKIYTMKIVKLLDTEVYFSDIIGTNLSEVHSNKTNMLRNAIRNNYLDLEKTIMVGDRKDDIMAARANKIASVGVTYGFGTKDELAFANADFLCNSVKDLKKVIY